MELTEVQKEADSAGRKAVIFGVGALFLAGLFGWMLAHLSGGGPEVVPLVVAGEEIPPLTHIKAAQLKVINWPKESRPAGGFAKIEDVVNTNEINTSGLLPGEPIIAERLSTPERGLGISQLVEPNMRAFVVQALDSVATAGMLHPGAYVDVLATFQDPRSTDYATRVILQNILVMAVGDSIDVEATRPVDKTASDSQERDRVERQRVVTLLVGLKDVEPLTLASRQGKIDLALRNNVDNQIVTTSGVTLEQVVSDKAPKINLDKNSASGSSGHDSDTHSMVPPATPSRSRSTEHRRRESGSPSIYKVRH